MHHFVYRIECPPIQRLYWCWDGKWYASKYTQYHCIPYKSDGTILKPINLLKMMEYIAQFHLPHVIIKNIFFCSSMIIPNNMHTCTHISQKDKNSWKQDTLIDERTSDYICDSDTYQGQRKGDRRNLRRSSAFWHIHTHNLYRTVSFVQSHIWCHTSETSIVVSIILNSNLEIWLKRLLLKLKASNEQCVWWWWWRQPAHNT